MGGVAMVTTAIGSWLDQKAALEEQKLQEQKKWLEHEKRQLLLEEQKANAPEPEYNPAKR